MGYAWTNWVSFASSPVLKPLQDAGGLIFPYTPSIGIGNSAHDTGIDGILQTNAKFQFFLVWMDLTGTVFSEGF